MTARPTLRVYQREAIEAVIAARRDGCARMAVCLPTGAGKTVIFSELARMARRPVMVLAHREELLSQAADKLQRAVGADKRVTIEQGERRADPQAEIVICSIRSLHERRLRRLVRERSFGLILYDECHHAVAEDNQRVLRQLGCFDAGWAGTLVGFTATTNRADGLGLDAVFDRIVFQRDLAYMLEDGWLVPLRGYRIRTEADLRELTGRGDFNEQALEEAIDIQQRNALVARSIQELARDRRTVVFCVTVQHARNLSKALNQVGVPTGLVHGQMAPERRKAELAMFRSGATVALTNVGVLTEGFDDPGVSCIAMARPTRSEGLYMQCVGRGTRLHPGKSDCLVLDFVDLSDLSLVTLPSLLGMPMELDLAGGSASEALQQWREIIDEVPDLELEPRSITLQEIRSRADAFDPLSREVDPAIRAVSQLAWNSLGPRGVSLHLLNRRGGLMEVLVVRDGRGRKPWMVRFDGAEQACFSRLEDAVTATEHELESRDPALHASGLPQAPWRALPAEGELAELAAQANRGRAVQTLSEAFAALTYAEQLRARLKLRGGR